MSLKGTDIFINLEKLKNGMLLQQEVSPLVDSRQQQTFYTAWSELKVNGEHLLGNNKSYLFVS